MLRAKEIYKTYGEKCINQVNALVNINLEISQGEFVSIVGRSGSGKSTLVNILSGLDTPTRGIVELEGQNIFQLSDKARTLLRRKEIGFIFQSYNLISVLSARENIELPQIDNNPKYVEELMNILDIYDRKDHLPNELSGGQQQRVSICRALVNKPKIVFADEPTGNLDSRAELEVIDLFKNLVKIYNTTIVLITHNLELTKATDRVIELNDGIIVN